jgi:hypothetical protein
MNGKGDTQRPLNKLAFDLGFDRIFGALRKRRPKNISKPKNQHQQVLDYLDTNGTITTQQANSHLGISRLSARIFELKQKGYEFDRVDVVLQNRVGKDIRCGRWRLKS